mgnify:CR=1 FL=1
MKIKKSYFKQIPTTILRLVLLTAATVVLVICSIVVWHTIAEINSASSFHSLSLFLLIGVLSSSVPYFIALYQAFKLLRLIDTNGTFTISSVKALKIITRCSIVVFAICAIAGLPFFYTVAKLEDAPGLVFIGIAITGFSFTIAVFASVLNRLLQEAIKVKTENDLTI